MALHSANYDIHQETWQTQEQSRDKHLLRIANAELAATGRVTVRMPEMKGGTTIVPLPYPEFNDAGPATRILPDRWNEDPQDPRNYNRWLFRAKDMGVTRFGKQWISVLFDNPEDTGWNFDTDHPIQLIYRQVSFAVKKKLGVQVSTGSQDSDDWELLLKGDQSRNQYEVIKRPEIMFLMYAAVYASGTNNYLQEYGHPLGAGINDPLVVFVMSRATGAAFMDEIDKPRVKNDPGQGLLHPNVTGCRFVHFYDKKLPSCPMLRNVVSMSSGDDGGFGGGTVRRTSAPRLNDQAATGFGYAVAISETLDGTPADKGGRAVNRDAIAKHMLKRMLPWEKTIRGHTPAECAELVQSMSGLPLSVMEYAWQNHPEFFNSVTKGLLRRRVTSAPPPFGGRAVNTPSQPRQPATDPFSGPVNDDGDDDTSSPFDSPLTSTATPIATVNSDALTATSAADAPTDDLYTQQSLDALQARLRIEMAKQGKPGPVPSLPAPPPFRDSK